MNALNFILNYPIFLEKIEQVIKPEYQQALEVLKSTDAHDIISPDFYFSSNAEMQGFVFNLFINEVKRMSLGNRKENNGINQSQ